MKVPYSVILWLLSIHLLVAQVIPAARRVDWQNTGYSNPIPNPTNIVNVKSFGAMGDGVTDDYTAVINAMNSFGGGQGVVFFPSGTYLIKNQIMVNKDSVIFRGISSDSTLLHFDFNGATKNGFNIWGGFPDTIHVAITGGLIKGSNSNSNTITEVNSAHYRKL